MKPWALITGATSGIGKETALLMAKNNFNLVLTGRRDQKLREIKSTLQEKSSAEVEVLNFDVSSLEQCKAQFEKYKNVLDPVSILINNAGLARGVAPLQEAEIQDWEEMIDTNLKGLLYMTRLCLPSLQKNRPAHIVNIGSVAGRWSYPGGGVYCSTKFAVRAISEGLRMDLIGKDIRVTNIEPGLVETEFSEVRLRNKEQASEVYKGFDALRPQDIAECIVWSLQRPQHVNIQEMVVFPTAQASVTQVHRN